MERNHTRLFMLRTATPASARQTPRSIGAYLIRGLRISSLMVRECRLLCVFVLLVAGGGQLEATTVIPPGSVFAWGDNQFQQLNVPGGLSGVVGIAAGFHHCLAVKSNGTVVAWGGNEYGQSKVPPMATNVAAVAAGRQGSLALRRDGSLVAWGFSGTGQVVDSNIVAISAMDENYLALRSDGTFVEWGLSQYVPPVGLSNVVGIAAGGHHSLALKQDGTIVGWGDNASGQLNIPVDLDGVVAVAAGVNQSLALKNDGTVVFWGGGGQSILYPPDELSNVVAIAAGYVCNMAVTRDSRVVVWGSDFEGQRRGSADLAGAEKVALGYDFCVALGGPVAGPPLLINEPEDRIVTAGASVSFSVVATGPGLLSYQWRSNGANIVGATSPTFWITSVSVLDKGKYSVVVSNEYGPVTSREGELAIVPAPEFWVSNLGDSGSGSLRSAIGNAVLSGRGRIVFTNVSGTITLSKPLPEMSGHIQILGPGRSVITISADDLTRVMTVYGEENLLANLSFTHGAVNQANGGGIVNYGSLTISNCTIANCRVFGGFGGAIYTVGDLTIVGTEIANNNASAPKGTPGSAVPSSPAYGGGICVENGTLSISCSTLTNNWIGGGLGSYDPWVLQAGGDGKGGAISIRGSAVRISESSLTGNSAGGGSGGSNLGAGGNGGTGLGGAVFVDSGSLFLTNCTLSGNRALGGFGGTGLMASSWGGQGGDAYGGALYAAGGDTSANSCTFATNSSVGGGGQGRNSRPGAGYTPGIYNTSGTVRLLNSILTDANHGGFESKGYNLISDTSESSGFVSNDQVNVSANLGPLQNNGGPTLTHALLPGSLAIDAGARVGAPAMDQRGYPRPAGLAVDIGAYESGSAYAVAQFQAGNVQIVFFAEPNRSFPIQATTNSSGWQTIGTFPSTTTGRFLFEEPANLPMRFYRLLTVH